MFAVVPTKDEIATLRVLAAWNFEPPAQPSQRWALAHWATVFPAVLWFLLASSFSMDS